MTRGREPWNQYLIKYHANYSSVNTPIKYNHTTSSCLVKYTLFIFPVIVTEPFLIDGMFGSAASGKRIVVLVFCIIARRFMLAWNHCLILKNVSLKNLTVEVNLSQHNSMVNRGDLHIHRDLDICNRSRSRALWSIFVIKSINKQQCGFLENDTIWLTCLDTKFELVRPTLTLEASHSHPLITTRVVWKFFCFCLKVTYLKKITTFNKMYLKDRRSEKSISWRLLAWILYWSWIVLMQGSLGSCK